MAVVLGIDGGTESLRASVFDLDGRMLGFAAEPYATAFPEPGRAEQDPAAWWRSLTIAVPAALAKAGVAAGDVIALCADTTCCSVVALGADFAPLRPALIWMDVRAAEEAAAVAATGDPALRVNGAGRSAVSAEWMLPKALWIARHEPAVWERAVHVGEYQDYLNWRLTGRFVGSLNNASIRWHWQTGYGGAPTSLAAAIGLADLPERWPREILAPGAPVGGLTDAAAAAIGLRPGTLVVQGGADAFIGMIGLGVAEPGEMALITGSSHLQIGVTSAPVHKPGVWGTYMDAVYPGKAIIEGGQTSTGSILNWFRSRFTSEAGYDALNAAAALLQPGAEGLTVLDHFQGNRTPYTDPLSRGAIVGLTLKHGPEHVYRAMMEAIAFGTRLVVESFGEAFEAKRVVAAGGATRSQLMMKIHADVLGRPLELTEVADAPALGSAILAAVGAGRFGSIEEGAAAMVRVTRQIEPDLAEHDRYAEVYDRYLALYPALKSLRENA